MVAHYEQLVLVILLFHIYLNAIWLIKTKSRCHTSDPKKKLNARCIGLKNKNKKARGGIEFGSYLAFCPTEMGNLGGFAPLQLTSKAKFYRQ